MAKQYNVINNYIYFYHLLDNKGNGTFLILPAVPELITDTTSVRFEQTSILARTAPIFTYSNSGPRTVQITLPLHRDTLNQFNINASNLELDIGEDYLDKVVNYLQAVALPSYVTANKMVNPPLIAVRLGDDLFIKGVVIDGVTTTKRLPLLEDGRYGQVEVSFTIAEVDPYDAVSAVEQGMLRGLSTTLERNLYKRGS